MLRPHSRRAKRALLALAAAGGCVLATAVAVPASAGTTDGAKAAYQASCPVGAEISQGYHDGHDGVDLAAPIGTPIFAAGPGEVTESGPASGYGQWIRIKHPDGSVSEYGHMSERFVQVGDAVEGGAKIASVGNEGQSTGPHLHFEVHLDGGTGVGDDPLAYMSERGVSLPCTP
ncbi:M23 family metallopeptidase [Streptomyces winkii]|uniref:M23 family metallopeptidase n=1 Tax=Streptomyces winkii TaxID=3051178 RepID=UPI0028D6E1EF|nr:M23 family metallopeptidase [Streptomyces sp. DSM 40971]